MGLTDHNFVDFSSKLKCIEPYGSIRNSNAPSLGLREIQTEQGYRDSNRKEVDHIFAYSLLPSSLDNCFWFLGFEPAILNDGRDDVDVLEGLGENIWNSRKTRLE